MKQFSILNSQFSILLALFACAALAALMLTGCSQNGNPGSAITPDELERGFAEPPASAKPHTWWQWMNGNISKEGITADLEAMAGAGLGGAQIFNGGLDIPKGPIRFNSPEWLDMVKHAASEAKRLGLDLGIHNCPGWATSGGPWNTPEHAMKKVVTSEMQVKGGTTVAAPPPQPAANLDFYRDIVVLAFRTPAANPAARVVTNLHKKMVMSLERIENQAEMLPEMAVLRNMVIDLTDRLLPSGGSTTSWDAPEGDWTLLRAGYTIIGRTNNSAPDGGTGLECDKLSREAVKAQWDGHVGAILAAIDGQDRPGLNNILIDSYEAGSQNWTQGLEKEFEKRCGYPILKFLPVFTGRIVDSPDVTERFLWDFRRVMADLFAENYAEYFGELAHRAGLLFFCESFGSSLSDDVRYGSFCDVPMGEFWMGGGAYDGAWCTKQAASIAHVYGRKMAAAEAFSATRDDGNWKISPLDLKAKGDAVYCRGINRMIYHRYAHQPWTNPTRYPGMTMGQYGTHFERTLTWWKQGKEWLRYQARCQYMLQEGRFVADVLAYNGENIPNEFQDANLCCSYEAYRTWWKHQSFYGYDYDECDTRALKMLKVKDGRLVLPSGMSYRMLVLPDDPVMSPEILKVIGKLVDAGAVVIAKNRPERAFGLHNYPESDAEVARIADKIWPEVISDKLPADVLQSLGIKPDFSSSDEDHVRYIHRKGEGADWYFVACSNQKGGDVTCTFRVSGMTPEFWHPETGETETVPVYEEKDGHTTIPIRFSPAGSVFVVFRQPASGDHAVHVHYTAAKKPEYKGDLKIVKAEYGYFADEDTKNCANVTEVVRKSVAGGEWKVISEDEWVKVDPAPGFAKELRINYRVYGANKQLRIPQMQRATLPRGAEIISAWYGLSGSLPEVDPPRKTADVTGKLASLVVDGAITVAVNSELAGGKDPAAASPKKEVRVEYLYNGTRGRAKAGENKRLILPPEPDDVIPLPACELRTADSGNVEIRAWESGSFEVTMASGKTWSTGLVNVPDAVEIGGAWQLSFPPQLGRPAAGYAQQANVLDGTCRRRREILLGNGPLR